MSNLTFEQLDALSKEERLATLATVRPKNDDELWHYIKFFWGITFPREAACKGRCTAPFKVLADCYFARYPLIILKGARGCGKAQSVDSPVLTPKGWARLGDIQPGDFVIDESGKPTAVLQIHPQGPREVYRVSFNDGTSTLATEDHIWKVSTVDLISKGPKKGESRGWVTKTTRELMADLRYPRGDLKWRIPVTQPVQFSTAQLPIDPYLLGLLLGDGGLTNSTPRFTTADPQLVSEVEARLPADVCLKKVSGKYTYSIAGKKGKKNPVTASLVSLGLMRLNSKQKFIPEPYLYADIEQRLDLLKGLLDTDGYARPNGGIEYVTASSRLAEGVTFLVQSLGGTVKKAVKTLAACPGHIYHRLAIKLPICPFRLQRKQNVWVAPSKYPVYRLITSIEFEKIAEAKCITVESHYHTYLTNDCIVTHNSALLTTLAITEAATLGAAVDILGASEKQSKIILSYLRNENPRTVGQWWSSPNAPVSLIDRKEDLKTKQVLTNKGYIECLTASPTTVRGRRPTRLRLDEVDEADLNLIKSAQGCPQSDPVNNIKKNTLMASTHQHADGTLTFYIKMARERNQKAGKVVIPIYQYCYRDVLTTNGGFLDPEEIEETKLTVPEDVWEAEFENGEPSTAGRVFTAEQIDFLFDKSYGEFNGDVDEECDVPFELLFPEEEHVDQVGSRKRKRKVMEHLEFAYGADFANDVDWTIFDRLVLNSLEDDPIVYRQGWRRHGRRPTWREIVYEYNDFFNEYPGLGYHDETGRKNVNDDICCDSEGFTFTKLSRQEILNDLIVAIQNKKIKGPYIDYAYWEMKFLTKEHISGKKHLPDSVASLALAWYARNNGLGPIRCEVL